MRPPLSRSIHRKPRLPDAETLIIEVLTFLGDNSDGLERFLISSGLALGDVRTVAGTPVFAESLLEHLCADERLLVAFANGRGYDPAAIELLRQSFTPPLFEG